MADHIDHGGPAFPCMPPQDTAAGVAVGYPYPDSGMTLRDYFAAKAMHGLVARTHTKDESGRPFVEWVAELSYELADAMLKARATR